MPAHVQITGIRELQKALRQMDSDLPKQLRVALNNAGQIVVNYAQPRVAKRSGRAAGSIKLRSSQREAKIAAGGRRAPYFPWLDYGGYAGRGKRNYRQFRKEGRYIYPAVRENQTKIQAALQEELSKLISNAGLEET
jgi:hypothetical protein